MGTAGDGQHRDLLLPFAGLTGGNLFDEYEKSKTRLGGHQGKGSTAAQQEGGGQQQQKKPLEGAGTADAGGFSAMRSAEFTARAHAGGFSSGFAWEGREE